MTVDAEGGVLAAGLDVDDLADRDVAQRAVGDGRAVVEDRDLGGVAAAARRISAAASTRRRR